MNTVAMRIIKELGTPQPQDMERNSLSQAPKLRCRSTVSVGTSMVSGLFQLNQMVSESWKFSPGCQCEKKIASDQRMKLLTKHGDVQASLSSQLLSGLRFKKKKSQI